MTWPSITSVSPAAFGDGRLVVVSGSNFGSDGSLRIGGVAQNIQSWADNQITFLAARDTQNLGPARIAIERTALGGGGGPYLSGPALVAVAGSEQSHGTIYPGSRDNRLVYDASLSPGYGLKQTILLGRPPTACGGSVWFGGRWNLPTLIPQGYNIWYRVMCYLPSTLPMGQCYTTNGNSMSQTGTPAVQLTLGAGASGGASSVTLAGVPKATPAVGYSVAVVLDSGAIHLTTVSSYSYPTVGLAAPLPSAAAAGKNVYFRDKAEAVYCGKGGFTDGPGKLKFLVMAPDAGTSRCYVLPNTPLRGLGLGNGWNLNTEAENTGDFSSTTQVVPRDAWFSAQLQIYVHSTEGFMRFWQDEEFVGEHPKNTLVSSTDKMEEWGLGDYWNGVPFTDGDPSRTDAFWIRDIIIATDYPGFGAPLAQDSGGRPFINPAITVADL